MPHPLERVEMAALVDIVRAVPPDVAAASGFDATTVGAAVCIAARGMPAAREFNHVVGADADTDLDAVAGFYGGTPHIVSGSAELEDALQARGYRPGYAWMKFARPADAGARAPTELRVAAVGSDRAQDFAAPVLGGFEMPASMAGLLAALPGREGWTCCVAYDDGRPVGAGALFVAGGQGWLGFAATLPDARGRGAQSAILAARIRRAAELGCEVVTTETGVRVEGRPDRSYRNILRAGFEEVFERPNWRSPA